MPEGLPVQETINNNPVQQPVQRQETPASYQKGLEQSFSSDEKPAPLPRKKYTEAPSYEEETPAQEVANTAKHEQEIAKEHHGHEHKDIHNIRKTSHDPRVIAPVRKTTQLTREPTTTHTPETTQVIDKGVQTKTAYGAPIKKTGQQVDQYKELYRAGERDVAKYDKEKNEQHNKQMKEDYFNKPNQKKSVFEMVRDVASNPGETIRKAKERAEEIGYNAEQKYHEKRTNPIKAKATQLADERMRENDIKYNQGLISKEIHAAREKKYLQDVEKAVPFEQKVAKEATTAFNMAIGDPNAKKQDSIAGNIFKGLEQTHHQATHGVGSNGKDVYTYRASPAPHFKPGKGTRRTTPTKGTVRSMGQPSRIDFGRSTVQTQSSVQPQGNPAFNFNTPLFGGRQEPQRQTRKKR